jgi:hypothetical protein
MNLATLVGVVVGAASCSHAHSEGLASVAGVATPDYCEMAVVALAETIKSNREQPYGLEDACVNEVARVSGKVYVDARFMEGTALATVPVRSCVRRNYVVRFDHKAFERSPAPGVVLLLVSTPTAKGREFNAVVEDPNWPAKRPGTFALSQCGSAFGILRGSGTRWTAQIVPPPRHPGDL